MVGIKETFKKIYENKNVHIWLFVLVLVGAVLSNIFDIAVGKPDTYKQNIVDAIVSLFLGVCALQFLHNVLHNENNGEISLFDKIKAGVYWKLIAVGIIWALMLGIIIVPVMFACIMTGVAGKLFLALFMGAVALLSVFSVYVNITLADTMEIGKSVNPMIIFRAFARVLGPTYIQFFKYLGLSILFVIVFLVFYVVGGLLGLESILKISEGCSVFDIFMHGIAWYVLFILWSLMYPYSLLESYREKLREEK